jgi:tight adherence protein B
VTPTLLTVLTFLAGILLVAGVYSFVFDLVLRDRARVSQRLESAFQRAPRARAARSPIFKDLGKVGAETAAEAQAQKGLRQRFEAMVEQSGLVLTPQRLVLIMAVCGLALGGLAAFLTGWWVPGVVVGTAGAAAPALYVQFQRKRRLERLLAQLPDALDLIGRLIRAGQTISQAFQGVADEFMPPLGAEFAYCAEQQRLGLAPEIALRDLGQRVGLVEMKIFVLAVLVQRQTGGNLAELIDNLANLVRERFRIRGKIKVLTAEGRMEAAVLLALPPVVFGLIFLLNRGYALVLFDHPNLVYGTLGLMLVGLLWIRRIINFDF